MSFESNVRRLEAIVGELEQRDLDLDKALRLFEEGIKCLRAASAELGDAEVKVKTLVEQSNGLFELPDHER